MTAQNLSFSGPEIPPEVSKDLINTSSKELETYDPFIENFGSKNKSGEIVLYEASAEIVRMAIFAYANYDESCELISPGKIAIIFYPNIVEIRVILQPSNDLWPVRNERIEENKKFDYEGWFWRNNRRDRMCKRREDLAPFEKEKGFVFGDWNYYGVAFGTEKEIFELKATIRSIQARMSSNRIPKVDELQNNSNLRVSRFWCSTGFRPSSLKVVCIHIGSVWRINRNYSVELDKNGMIALASKNETPCVLEMLVIFRITNGEVVEDVRKCYKVPASMRLVLSHITPESKQDVVWEWVIGGDLWACAFKNLEEAESFKGIIDSYVSNLKKSSKKFFGRK